MIKSFSPMIIFAMALNLLVATQAETKSQPVSKFDPALYRAMQWREIGPFRGGRSVAVAGHPNQKNTYYFGATGGGIWKTEDGGTTWKNVSDGYLKNGSIGAIAVAESDPTVVYVGTGEACIRSNVIPGNGVYKSTDAGKTWKHMGLAETRFIGSVNVHPQNPDLVYVAALGHVFGPNPDRGVYRSRDGGKTWEKILYKDTKTGAIDLSIDPSNPRILYASLWEAYRNAWTLSSGGPGSGLYKSTDSGDTWSDLSKNNGLPTGIKGRIGVAVSPAKPDRVWALIEAEGGGLFRSDDGGLTWSKMSDDHRMLQRAWYYTHVYADPKNPDVVFILNVQFLKSIDSGKTFSTVLVPHGDNHDLWIDPNDPLRMINGNDGGANVSYNGGQTWSRQDQPTAQFYHVSVDTQFPYHIYGAQQDNSTVSISSRTPGAGIDRSDWYAVGGGESGYVVANPKDPAIVYAGNYGGVLTRYNHRTREIQNISVWPETSIGSGAGNLKYRFQWTYPIVVSPHDPNVLYVTGNYVFKSTNEGMSWEIGSPDLSRHEKTKMAASGGPITKDNTGAEYYGTIFTLAESPVLKGVLWAGSDDGLIHMTRDGGANWQNITPKDLPEWALISLIEASPHDAATAYVAATRYKLDDFKPYIYRTSDYGKTWKKITEGIANDNYVRVVREDPHRKGLLYAGTENGVFVSFDDGGTWQSLQLNLPLVPIHDLVVHPRDNDLVVATHGRSFWVLDDITPLRRLDPEMAKSDMYLFQPRPTYRFHRERTFLRPTIALGKNPPDGALIYYYFKAKPQEEVKLEILDEQGQLVKAFSSKQEKVEQETVQEPEEELLGTRTVFQRLPAEAGMNRFAWDLHYRDATKIPGSIMRGGNLRGPMAIPGKYQVRLVVGQKKISQVFEVVKDPRVKTTPEEFKEQFDFLTKIREQLSAAHHAVNTIRDIRKQTNDLVKRLSDHAASAGISEAAKALNEKLTGIEEEIIQVKIKSSHDVLNYPVKLNNKLATLASVVASADSKPTKQSYDVFDALNKSLVTDLSKLRRIIDSEIPAFNRMIKDKDVPMVVVKPAEKITETEIVSN